VADMKKVSEENPYIEPETTALVQDPVMKYMDKPSMQKAIDRTEKEMLRAAKEMDFVEAARLRDEWEQMKEKLKSM
jgi:excinuclease ABC subunit B